MVADGGTRLEFTAEIAKVNTVTGKLREYGPPQPGRVEITLVVEAPVRPQQGYKPWSATTPRPEAAESGPDGEARLAKRQADWDETRAAFERMEAEHSERMDAYGPRLMAYAQLVGIAAVFGSQKLNVVMRPVNQDLLPGFGVELLDAPAEAGE